MPTEMGDDASGLTVTKFDRHLHDSSGFSCGFAPIDNFLKLSLSDQVRDGMVIAWIAAEGGRSAVLAFYTLGAVAVRAEFGPKKGRRSHVPDVPVIYIRAIAVREDMQGRRLGTALLIDAMRRCVGIADQMGAAGIVLDVLGDGEFECRWKFYAELGFQPMCDPDNPRRVYSQMSDVRSVLV